MGALLTRFAAAGVRIEPEGVSNLRVHGALTDALRATIKDHKCAILAELAANDAAPIDPGALRRRDKTLAILAEHPERRLAAVAEPGDPAHITVAIRDAVVGELTINADTYDGFTLLALMQQYGHA